MPQHGRPYSANRSRRTTQRVQDHTVGTHVKRTGKQEARRRPDMAEVIRRRAQMRRIAAGVIGVAIVLGAALLAATLAFRGSVGSSMALRDSTAAEALTAPAGSEPYYVLISAELGAVAAPLDNAGPDVFLLARVDNAGKGLSLISIPPDLQVTRDGKSTDLAAVASQGDGELIDAVKTFTKLDIAHFVKMDEEGIAAMVENLGGIDVDLEQVIDDPQAGDIYLPAGSVTLNGSTALQYLRADNLKLGRQDKVAHQLKFATLVLEKLFNGNFDANIDAIDDCFQTDMALADMEAVASWFSGRKAGDIVVTTMPGYVSAVTSVGDGSRGRFIGSAEDFTELIAMLERGETPPANTTDGIEAADPSTVTVDIQNGTTITGAASLTGEELTAAGFKIGEVGNAEQQVYTETLVIYKDDALAQAKAVIEALGVGRPVEAGSYYSFDGNVLVIIGSDFSPIA